MWKEENRNRKNTMPRDNRGVHAIEASIIIPLILFLAAGIILLIVSQGRREVLREEMIHTLYTLPVSDELDGDPKTALYSLADQLQAGHSRAELGNTSSGDQLALSGSVPYTGIGSYSGVLAAHAKRERDLCSKRLRRWQFYGNIAED